MKKLAAVVGVVVVLGAGGLLALRRQRSGGTEPRTQLETAAVERGSLRVSVTCSGRVVSRLDVDIKCKASGEIVTLPFDVSDVVRKGELLVELDPVDEQRSLKQAEVALAASQARLVTARQNLDTARKTLVTDGLRASAELEAAEAKASDARAKADRIKELSAKKLASNEEHGTAEATAVQAAAESKCARVRLEELKTQEAALETKRQDVRLAETQVEADMIAVAVAEDRLKDTRVVAPLSGVVSARNVEIGQIISSGISNVSGGTTILTISDLARVFVLASVDESDIGGVRLDQPVTVTVDALPGRTFRGQVCRIATKGVNVSNVVTFEVKIEILGETKELLKPEMTADVEIVTVERHDVLTVPVGAVLRKGEKHLVSVVGQGRAATERSVEPGVSDGTRTEILSGLEEGEQVVVHRATGRWDSVQNQGGGPPRPPMF